jgi:teichoic acid transport system permease protein
VSQVPTGVAAEAGGLRQLGGRPTLTAYLRQLWRRRHFALELARSRFRAENEATRLGAAWIVLRPMINAAVYGFVFVLLLPSSTRPQNFLPFLVIGVFVFQYFSACFSDGARSIIFNMGLVTTLRFPRAVLPISIVLQQIFGLLWMVAMMVLLVLLSGEPPRVTWPLIVPALFLMTLFNLGVAFIAARLTIHLRDVTQLIPFITRIIFYLSGIFFRVGNIADGHPTIQMLLAINPVHVYITLVRVALLGPGDIIAGSWDPVQAWLLGAAWGVGFLVVGFLYFWRAEDRYGRD